MAYNALTQNDLSKWWITGTGSVVNRLSEVMDDMPDGPAIYHLDAANAWTAGAGSEWYVATATKPDDVADNLSGWSKLTDAGDDQMGSLNADEWTFDTGNDRVYVRLSDSSDPNATDMRKHYAWDGSGAGSAIMSEYVEDGIYQIHQKFEIGDGSTSTTLISLNEMVYFDSGILVTILANAKLEIGEKSGNSAKSGSCWKLDGPNSTNYIIASPTSELNIYGSLIIDKSLAYNQIAAGPCEIIHVIVDKGYSEEGHYRQSFGITSETGGKDINGLWLSNAASLFCDKPGIPWNDIRVHECGYGLKTNWTAAFNDITITGSIIGDIFTGINGANITVTDMSGTIDVVVNNSADNFVLQVYTCNIHISDKDHVGIEDLNVTATWSHIVIGTDSNAYRCIQDHTADNDKKPITGGDWTDYWVQIVPSGVVAAGVLESAWISGFDYKTDEADFSVSTIVTGIIPEQDMVFRKWTGTSEEEETRIHKFVFSKAGYLTLIFENQSVNRAIKWNLELQPINHPPAIWEDFR